MVRWVRKVASFFSSLEGKNTKEKSCVRARRCTGHVMGIPKGRRGGHHTAHRSCAGNTEGGSSAHRSRMFLEVSSFPDFPASGDLLTPIEMDMVGCSTSIGSRGRGLEGSTSVSPMSKSSTPEKTTMSPADASSTAMRPMALKTKSSDTLTVLTGWPGPEQSPMEL